MNSVSGSSKHALFPYPVIDFVLTMKIISGKNPCIDQSGPSGYFTKA
jgi:hypothetical protein